MEMASGYPSFLLVQMRFCDIRFTCDRPANDINHPTLRWSHPGQPQRDLQNGPTDHPIVGAKRKLRWPEAP